MERSQRINHTTLLSVIVVLVASTTTLVLAQNEICYLCGGDQNATFLLPDVVVPLPEGSPVPNATCATLFNAAIARTFTAEQCAMASSSQELQVTCGCSNIEGLTAPPVAVPSPTVISSPVTIPAPVIVPTPITVSTPTIVPNVVTASFEPSIIPSTIFSDVPSILPSSIPSDDITNVPIDQLSSEELARRQTGKYQSEFVIRDINASATSFMVKQYHTYIGSIIGKYKVDLAILDHNYVRLHHFLQLFFKTLLVCFIIE